MPPPPEWQPLRGIFHRKKCFRNGMPVSNGLFPLDTLIIGLASWEWGFPASSREVIQSQPWQLVSSMPWTTIRERYLRGNKECCCGCRPESSTSTHQRRAPVGLVPGAELLLHPFPGPLHSSSCFQNSSHPEWVFVCTPEASLEEL